MSSNSNSRSNRRSNGNGSTPKKTSPKRLFWICALLFILINGCDNAIFYRVFALANGFVVVF
mgnify:CR=1 FL=1